MVAVILLLLLMAVVVDPMEEAVVPTVEVEVVLNAVLVVDVVLANAAVNTVIAVPPLTIVELVVKVVPVAPQILLQILLLNPIMVMAVVKAVVSNGATVVAGLGPMAVILPEVLLICTVNKLVSINVAPLVQQLPDVLTFLGFLPQIVT